MAMSSWKWVIRLSPSPRGQLQIPSILALSNSLIYSQGTDSKDRRGHRGWTPSPNSQIPRGLRGEAGEQVWWECLNTVGKLSMKVRKTEKEGEVWKEWSSQERRNCRRCYVCLISHRVSHHPPVRLPPSLSQHRTAEEWEASPASISTFMGGQRIFP